MMLVGRCLPPHSFIALAALMWQAVTSGTPPPQQPFKSGARTVAVYATVADGGGRLVTDLTSADFEIKDEGKPRPITVFSNDVRPISVVVLLDRSASMRGNGRLVTEAAQAFIDRLEPADKARIGIFAERIEIQPGRFTSDHQELTAILQTEVPVRGPTPLWNAIDEGIAALQEEEGRRVVLVFSDGGDSPSTLSMQNRSMKSVMRRAQSEDVMVYAIGLQTTVVLGRSSRGGVGGMTGSMTSVRPDPGLSIVAEDTGGGYFELVKGENLAKAFAQVADELHHQYAIGFEPTALDDRMHKLELKIKKGGLKARARKEYFAAAR